MNYAQMRKYDIANGENIRASLFVSGCSHNCKDCFNKEYQSYDYGTEWTKEVEDLFMGYVADKNVKGVSILGGEPFDHVNVATLATLVKRIKQEFPSKTVWVWSGYTIEQILKDEKMKVLLMDIDVLIDGRFVLSKKDLKLRFRGSSNQRIIDVQKTLNEEKIILFME